MSLCRLSYIAQRVQSLINEDRSLCELICTSKELIDWHHAGGDSVQFHVLGSAFVSRTLVKIARVNITQKRVSM